MYLLLIAIHVLACLILIAVILLQAGKGGGLAETFGGGGGFQTIFGTKASKFLTRATAVFAIAFLLTSLSLAMLSAKRGESLLKDETISEKAVKPGQAQQTPQPQPTTAQPQTPVTEEKQETPQSATGGEQTPK